MAERSSTTEMAGLLRQCLNSLIRTEGGMSNASALAASSAFWVDVFATAFLTEAWRYPGRPWEEVMGELDGVLKEMHTAAKRRLALAWKDNHQLWSVPEQ